MAIVWDCAMTAEEFENCPLPRHPAWMSCRFSRTGPGLENLPKSLPQGCLLVCDDLYPLQHHDPALITRQLRELAQRFSCSGVLFDFQRKDQGAFPILQAIGKEKLHFAVTEHYAKNLCCAVFLPPPPLNIPLNRYLHPWKGREIFLECAPGWGCITITQTGSHYQQTSPFSGPLPFEDKALHCRYRTQISANAVSFYLHRDLKHLESMAAQGESLGVTHAVGLYRELRGK